MRVASSPCDTLRVHAAVGMNYHDHCAEIGVPTPTEPVLFSKFASSISCSGQPIPLDEDLTQELDWEVELCIVVGRKARHVPKERALEYIAGWTVAHDVSARDLQLKRNGGQWLLGKTCDGFSPIGPAIVTRDEGAPFVDAASLGVRCFVNGERMQNSNTRELVFKPADLIACAARPPHHPPPSAIATALPTAFPSPRAGPCPRRYASTYFTLNPGDLIFTGTPGGVGIFRKPPVSLRHGDEVVVEIDGIGKLTNVVTATTKLDATHPCKRAKL